MSVNLSGWSSARETVKDALVEATGSLREEITLADDDLENLRWRSYGVDVNKTACGYVSCIYLHEYNTEKEGFHQVTDGDVFDQASRLAAGDQISEVCDEILEVLQPLLLTSDQACVSFHK